MKSLYTRKQELEEENKRGIKKEGDSPLVEMSEVIELLNTIIKEQRTWIERQSKMWKGSDDSQAVLNDVKNELIG